MKDVMHVLKPSWNSASQNAALAAPQLTIFYHWICVLRIPLIMISPMLANPLVSYGSVWSIKDLTLRSRPFSLRRKLYGEHRLHRIYPGVTACPLSGWSIDTLHAIFPILNLELLFSSSISIKRYCGSSYCASSNNVYQVSFLLSSRHHTTIASIRISIKFIDFA